VPVTSLNGTRMVYSCLNGCGGTEKVPSMKMKHGDRYRSLVWCLSTRTTTTSECSVVWWMVLPFYYLCMSVYRDNDNINQVTSFYK
jgi:hypothetical protein